MKIRFRKISQMFRRINCGVLVDLLIFFGRFITPVKKNLPVQIQIVSKLTLHVYHFNRFFLLDTILDTFIR